MGPIDVDALQVLRGHESGVLSLSWCAQDPDLLLSSGMDNRTICWNPQTGQAYGEFPVVTNWTFETRWYPHNPNFFATASFDGKISVQTIQNTGTETAKAIVDENLALDGEDFFAKAQTQPQVSSFSLSKPPRWLQRPCSVSFGFGGRVVSVGLVEKGKRTSKVQITPFEVDETVAQDTENFEKALKDGDLRRICEKRATSSGSDEEKADWKVIKALISDSPRTGLINYLGFNDQTAEEAADPLAKPGLNNEGAKPAKEQNGEQQEEKPKSGGGPPSAAAKKHKRLQSMFDTNAETDNFLSDLTSSKDTRTNNPFEIITGSQSDVDKNITRALLLGEFEKALNLALGEDRMSDAFMIAICGGPKCIEKAQEAYLSKQSEGPTYMRLLSSIAEKNLWDIVHNADLSNWKEIVAAICTYADDKEFADLCDALGDRLEDRIRSTGDKSSRKDASFCYLAGCRLEKVVGIWIEELAEDEKKGVEMATDNSLFAIHVHALQALIEKVTVFRHVTNFDDTERTKDSDWKLSALYDKYIEYADVAASHGRLQIAQEYLDLVPEKHPEAEVARNRIKYATRQPAPAVATSHQNVQAAAAKAAPAARQPYRSQQPSFSSTNGPGPTVQNPYAPPKVAAATATSPTAAGSVYSPPPPAVTSRYAPSTASTVPPPTNPYAPRTVASPVAPPANPYASIASNAYTRSPYQPSEPPAAAAPSTAFGAAAVPPPPRASAQSPAGPPAATYTTATNLPAWNDLPEGFAKPPMARRAMPAAAAAAAPVTSPFRTQSPVAGVPPPPTTAAAQRMPSVPPPPKGAAPPPRVASPTTSSRPTSVSSVPPSTNPYAQLPQPSPATSTVGMGIPPPPPVANRYAPSPVSTSQAVSASPSLQSRAPLFPPPPPASATSAYAPHYNQHPAGVTPSPPPPRRPSLPTPQVSRPGTAQSHHQAVSSAPAPQKYRRCPPFINE